MSDEIWTVRCPECGTELPKPVFSEVRTGGFIWKDGKNGIPEMAWVSKCPNPECGYLFCQKSNLTKYPTVYNEKPKP